MTEILIVGLFELKSSDSCTNVLHASTPKIVKFWVQKIFGIDYQLLFEHSDNPNTFTGVVGKVQMKEEGREGEEKKVQVAGARTQTRDLPRARRGSPAARPRNCVDKPFCGHK